MIVIKVILNNMTTAKNLVMISEQTPCEVHLRCNRFIVNAKSILGVLSLPYSQHAELHLDTEDQTICDTVISKLKTYDLLYEDILPSEKKNYDISAFGESLIDFTNQGFNSSNQKVFAQNPGGAPANVLVAATKLGSKTAILGKVGNDMHGVFLKNTFINENLNTDGLILDDHCFTTLAFVDLDENGERTFSFARKPGADTQMTPEEINLEIIENSHIFHVGSLSLTDNPSREATFHAVKYAKSKNVIVSYDPNYRASLWENVDVAKQHMRSMIPYVDIMKISDIEIELLTDKTTPEEAAKFLCDQGVTIVVVTLGKDGAYIATKDGGQTVFGFKSKVIDTTGAGDAFFGGFLHGVAQSSTTFKELQLLELANYVRVANAVASLCVEGSGAIPSMPSKENVCARLIGLN